MLIIKKSPALLVLIMVLRYSKDLSPSRDKFCANQFCCAHAGVTCNKVPMLSQNFKLLIGKIVVLAVSLKYNTIVTYFS